MTKRMVKIPFAPVSASRPLLFHHWQKAHYLWKFMQSIQLYHPESLLITVILTDSPSLIKEIGISDITFHFSSSIIILANFSIHVDGIFNPYNVASNISLPKSNYFQLTLFLTSWNWPSWKTENVSNLLYLPAI